MTSMWIVHKGRVLTWSLITDVLKLGLKKEEEFWLDFSVLHDNNRGGM